jgi:hypothetical protein
MEIFCDGWMDYSYELLGSIIGGKLWSKLATVTFLVVLFRPCVERLMSEMEDIQSEICLCLGIIVSLLVILEMRTRPVCELASRVINNSWRHGCRSKLGRAAFHFLEEFNISTKQHSDVNFARLNY